MSETEVARVRELVLRFGWNATAFQIVNPGIRHWFSAAGDAVIGYVRALGTAVVAGAPVCSLDRLEAVVDEWEAWARPRGRVCYFGAAGRMHALLAARRDRATLVLGAAPWWTPARWAETVAARPSLRAQLRRARNKGVEIVEWRTAQAEADPRLRVLLTEWLSTRGLPPLHFLVEPETLTRLEGRRIFVAERRGE
ncbi:MAG TPA: phosphatidylglycerol lysyltransferase domain-containing protein, partial [Planctomycetia bacterium]|nr:phosphatidylglycerol lysyltransferase domain-containing protein [Planctomycetia bacterium]